MTPYCVHRRYSMSRQKNSILVNEHALNREPVPLIVLTLYSYFVLLKNSARITWTVLCIAKSVLCGHSSNASSAATNAKATLFSTAAAQAAGSPSSPFWPWTCHKWEQYYEIIEMFLDYYGFLLVEKRDAKPSNKVILKNFTLLWVGMCFALMCLLITLFLRLYLEVNQATRTSWDF